MALQVSTLPREFKFVRNGKEEKLLDPNPEFTAEEVAKFHAGKHPELTNAIIDGPKVVGDKVQYTFTTKAGKLG